MYKSGLCYRRSRKFLEVVEVVFPYVPNEGNPLIVLTNKSKKSYVIRRRELVLYINTHTLAHCTLRVTKKIKKVGIIIFMLKELAHQLGRLNQMLLDRSTHVRRGVSVDFSNSLLPL
jgi:hypothetical protein